MEVKSFAHNIKIYDEYTKSVVIENQYKTISIKSM